MWKNQSSDNVRVLWNTILSPNSNHLCQSGDEEIVKVTLVLKSTLELFLGLWEKEVSSSGQLKFLKDEVERLESEKKVLHKEVSLLKNELKLQETEVKNHKQRLNSDISQEVEARLQAIFKNCLQQNKDAKLQDMMTQMTQMYQKTQVQGLECPATAKLLGIEKKIHGGSPDVIGATPDRRKKASQLENRSVKPKREASCPTKSINLLAASSPDEIAPTPPLRFKKKDNKKRREKFSKLFEECSQEDAETLSLQSESVKVFAKDTQDDDEGHKNRPALKHNIIIPGTLNPGSLELELNQEEDRRNINGKQEKENERISPAPNEGNSRTIADLSTDVEFPSTPKKHAQPRDKSPILGNSSGKKSSSVNRVSSVNSSMTESSKRSLASLIKTNSHHKSSIYSKHYETEYKTTSSGKTKNLYQMKLSKTRLSLPKGKGDISKMKEFCGGQRSSPDISVKITELDEDEKLQLAINNSLKESHSHERSSMVDDDPTMFEPISPLMKREQAVTSSRSNHKGDPILAGNSIRVREETSADTFFEPMCASTARMEDTPVKQRSAPVLGKLTTAQDVSQLSSENSNLDALLQLINKEETAPYPLETSFDRLPKKENGPNYAYQTGPLRKKIDRQNAPGIECTQCGKFYAAAFDLDDSAAKKLLVDKCSRHRERNNGPRLNTPPDFWNPEFPATEAEGECCAPSFESSE